MIKEAKILAIDLQHKTSEVLTLPAEVYRNYPGGSALGMYLLLQNCPPGTDPLSPENPLIFSVSPLTGIPISGQSRMTVTTKSPLTGTAGDSQVGGDIPAHLAANGYTSVMIRGKSDTPVYLYIDKEQVEIRDASHLWGKTTGDTEDLLTEELVELVDGVQKKIRFQASVIGPAGENLVKMANIMHQRSRANGRNGVGAVMGSKNLKALVVKNQSPVKPIDPEGMKTLTKNVKERMAANAVVLDTTENGTGGVVDGHLAEGFLPSRNWSTGTLPGGEAIAGTTITKTILKERETCFGCAIRCKRVVEIEGDENGHQKVDPAYGGPEYETLCTFGAYCGCTDLEDLCYANQLCNMYGIDTISAGATIAFAMDCCENGILTKEDTDGLDLRFGNSKVFQVLIPAMSLRTPGLGALLADGSYRAAEKIGKGSERLVVACKKQEAPAHMVQMKPNLAINYAVNPFGADHQSSEHDPALMAAKDSNDWIWCNLLADFEPCDSYGVLNANKAKFAWETQKFYSMMDTLCLCQFAWGPAWQLYGPLELIEFCKYGAGWETSIQELQEIGERRINLMRLFNAREGFTRKDDTLPEKMFLAMPDGPNAGAGITRADFEAALEAYYQLAGWDPTTGNPTPETIQRLNLTWIQ